MISIHIDAPGLDRQIRNLENYNKVATKQFRRAAREGTLKLVVEWKKISAVDTGRYRGSIAGEVKQIAGEIIGLASTNVRASGFPYPAALENSERYHYRAGPRRGQRTAGQVKKAVKRARKAVTKFYESAVRRIVKELKV